VTQRGCSLAYSTNVYIEDIHNRIRIPQRSRLFGLDPIGMNSPQAEGLISYLVRLAKEHCISPRLMISQEFLPRMREVNSVRHAEFYSDYAKTLQSTGKFAAKFVEIAEGLTCRQEIALLTALPWRGVVPAIGTGLMTQHPKWCKKCLSEDRDHHSAPYSRLAWGYALYQVCSQHHVQLVNECPWCSKHQPFFPNHADLSRCNYCYGWLGTCVAKENITNDQRQLWISSAIEDMITHGKQACCQLTGELFRDRLTSLVNVIADGKKTKLCEMLGLTKSTMATWIIKKQKPLFPQFLYLCHQMDLMPSEFLLGNFDLPLVKITNKPDANKLHHILPRVGLHEPPKADIHLRLKAICSDASDCRPLTKIATELSLTRKYLIYWFQVECHVISLKHKQSISQIAAHRRKEQILQVRNITWQLHSQGLYPSNRKVAEILAPLKLSLLKQHLRASHRKTLKDLNLSLLQPDAS
jgi:hypothetical protein